MGYNSPTIQVSDTFTFTEADLAEAKSNKPSADQVCPYPAGRLLRNGKFIPIACKSWKCPVCSKLKKFQMIKRFEHFCQPNVVYRMLTLTEWKEKSNYENSIQLLKHFNRLKSSLRRYNIVLADYFWVKEFKPLYHPNPEYTDKENAILYPHLHALVPASIDADLLSHLWYLATGETADHVHIPGKLDPALNNPSAYITKYVTKSSMKDGFKKNERRFGFSRKYKPNNVEYKYVKDDEVKTFKPVPSDGSGIFILNGLQASDDAWRQVEACYNQAVSEYREAHPKVELDEIESEHAELIAENKAEEDDYIETFMLETGYKGDYVIDHYIPVRVSSPANVYAKEKVKFFLKSLVHGKV